MKRLVSVFVLSITVAAPAFAADLPTTTVKAPVAAAPVFTWTGCYLGAQVGYAWQRDELVETVTATGAVTIFSPTDSADADGVKAGGFLGCNAQWNGPWVVGLDADAEFADLSGSAIFPNTGTPADFYEIDTDWQASIRGRLGYAFANAWGNSLLYVTGGVAFADTEYTYHLPAGGLTESFSETRTGWTVGLGLDHAFTPNCFWRLEYRYADFGDVTNIPVVVWTGLTETHETTEHAVRAGLAYKF